MIAKTPPQILRRKGVVADMFEYTTRDNVVRQIRYDQLPIVYKTNMMQFCSIIAYASKRTVRGLFCEMCKREYYSVASYLQAEFIIKKGDFEVTGTGLLLNIVSLMLLLCRKRSAKGVGWLVDTLKLTTSDFPYTLATIMEVVYQSGDVGIATYFHLAFDINSLGINHVAVARNAFISGHLKLGKLIIHEYNITKEQIRKELCTIPIRVVRARSTACSDWLLEVCGVWGCPL